MSDEFWYLPSAWVYTDTTPTWPKAGDASPFSYAVLKATPYVDKCIDQLIETLKTIESETFKHQVPNSIGKNFDRELLPKSCSWAGLTFTRNALHNNVWLTIGYEEPRDVPILFREFDERSDTYNLVPCRAYLPPHFYWLASCGVGCRGNMRISMYTPDTTPVTELPLPLYNVYLDTGQVCFGGIVPTSITDAINTFWATPFSQEFDEPEPKTLLPNFREVARHELRTYGRPVHTLDSADQQSIVCSDLNELVQVRFPFGTTAVTSYRISVLPHVIYRTHT